MLKKSISVPKELAGVEKSRQNANVSGEFPGRLLNFGRFTRAIGTIFQVA
jgi:hypothetical protein